MQRYKLTIEYDGKFFCGWQRQNGVPSVQQTIEEAVYAFCKQKTFVYGAGRTDAGVHALGQVAHVDLEINAEPFKVADALNFYLKNKGVVILKSEAVSSDFHARFSATSRSYIYQIMNRRAPLAIKEGRAWHVIQSLDVQKMQEAAQCFVGLHDFNSFRSIRCQAKSSTRLINSFEVRQLDSIIELKVKSKSFLHNQVRVMTGSLKLVGEGKWTKEDIEQALLSKHRTAGGPTAPPHGLYFASIEY